MASAKSLPAVPQAPPSSKQDTKAPRSGEPVSGPSAVTGAAAGEVPSQVSQVSQLSSISVSRSGDIPFRAPRRRRLPLLFIGLGVAGFAIGAAIFVAFTTVRRPPPAPAAALPEAPASRPTDPSRPSVAAPRETTPVVDPTTVPPESTSAQAGAISPATSSPSSKKPAAAVPLATVKKPPPPAPAPPPATATATQGKSKDCDVPYTIDKDGHKIWKKHCLQ
jgi:hypothetical protein